PKLLNAMTCPLLIAGPTVCIHHDELAVSTTEIAGLSLAHDPIEAHQRLSQLRLF
ncbi:helix-turn-helix-type transcriptional regulator, partial [Pseudomonas sp. CCC2.2]|nr:helix-turn-helix-type transcriptional regulator [Pseudomonas sp. CCC2.2]